MRLKNPWKAALSLVTPPRGRSERKQFSLGDRPIHGQMPKEQDPGNRTPIPKKLSEASSLLEDIFHVPGNSDVVFRQITCAKPHLKLVVAYIEGMSDTDTVRACVLNPLMLLSNIRKIDTRDPVEYLQEALLLSGQVQVREHVEEIVESMVQGNSVILVDGHDKVLVVETKGWKHRSVDAAQSERVVQGPQQGFIEVLRVNTGLIRSVVRSSDLVVEDLDLGVTVPNKGALLYMASIANDKMVAEARRRLGSLEVAAIHSSGVLEELVENSRSIIPTTYLTERPDRVARFLLEGSCAVIVDGDPFVMIWPINFFAFLQSPEDQTIGWPHGNILRLIRYISFLIVVLLPGLYVAILNYHSEMLPTQLLMAIAASREPIPVPLWLEVFIMYAGFELIREAGVRVPSLIGPTIGIVGALLIGDAAVKANLTSPTVVILIAITAVASFTIPNQQTVMLIRGMTFVFIVAGSLAGLYGIVACTYLYVSHASSLTSLGVPLLAPLAPEGPKSVSSPFAPRSPIHRRAPFLRPKDRFRASPHPKGWDYGKTVEGGADDGADSEQASGSKERSGE